MKFKLLAGVHRVNYKDEDGQLVGENKKPGAIIEDTKDLAKLYPEKFARIHSDETLPEEEVEVDADPDQYDGMTVAELRQAAIELGIELPSDAKKAELVRILKEATE